MLTLPTIRSMSTVSKLRDSRSLDSEGTPSRSQTLLTFPSLTLSYHTITYPSPPLPSPPSPSHLTERLPNAHPHALPKPPQPLSPTHKQPPARHPARPDLMSKRSRFCVPCLRKWLVHFSQYVSRTITGHRLRLRWYIGGQQGIACDIGLQ